MPLPEDTPPVPPVGGPAFPEQHFNRLRPDELERLAYLGEECVEVATIIFKVLRHGWQAVDYSTDPPTRYNNRALLSQEIGSVHAALTRMKLALDIDPKIGMGPIKLNNRYFHHQGKVHDLLNAGERYAKSRDSGPSPKPEPKG